MDIEVPVVHSGALVWGLVVKDPETLHFVTEPLTFVSYDSAWVVESAVPMHSVEVPLPLIYSQVFEDVSTLSVFKILEYFPFIIITNSGALHRSRRDKRGVFYVAELFQTEFVVLVSGRHFWIRLLLDGLLLSVLGVKLSINEEGRGIER